MMTENRETKKQGKVKILDNALTILMENDVPVKLRCSIIKWTRFNIDHAMETSDKKGMIDKLPFELQKGQCTTLSQPRAPLKSRASMISRFLVQWVLGRLLSMG